MDKNEILKEDLFQLINEAPQHLHIEVLDSVEYKLAMKQGDIAGAFDIADGIIHGKGKTKVERKRTKKKMEKEELLRKIV